MEVNPGRNPKNLREVTDHASSFRIMFYIAVAQMVLTIQQTSEKPGIHFQMKIVLHLLQMRLRFWPQQQMEGF